MPSFMKARPCLLASWPRCALVEGDGVGREIALSLSPVVRAAVLGAKMTSGAPSVQRRRRFRGRQNSTSSRDPFRYFVRYVALVLLDNGAHTLDPFKPVVSKDAGQTLGQGVAQPRVALRRLQICGATRGLFPTEFDRNDMDFGPQGPVEHRRGGGESNPAKDWPVPVHFGVCPRP